MNVIVIYTNQGFMPTTFHVTTRVKLFPQSISFL